MNQEAIVASFCINKDKPSLQCDGKCYLKKELKNIEQDQQDSHNQQIQVEQLVFLQPNPLDFIVPILAGSRELNSIVNNKYSFSPYLFLLRPPQL